MWFDEWNDVELTQFAHAVLQGEIILPDKEANLLMTELQRRKIDYLDVPILGG